MNTSCLNIDVTLSVALMWMRHCVWTGCHISQSYIKDLTFFRKYDDLTGNVDWKWSLSHITSINTGFPLTATESHLVFNYLILVWFCSWHGFFNFQCSVVKHIQWGTLYSVLDHDSQDACIEDFKVTIFKRCKWCWRWDGGFCFSRYHKVALLIQAIIIVIIISHFGSVVTDRCC